jgi:hypothetical protein
LKVIHTRSDGRTVIEVWTNGERVRDQDQVVNQGTEEVEVAGSNRQSIVDDVIKGPPKFNEPVGDENGVPDPVTETPEPAESDNSLFLTKLRNAIR